jgi:hypothetical protein
MARTDVILTHHELRWIIKNGEVKGPFIVHGKDETGKLIIGQEGAFERYNTYRSEGDARAQTWALSKPKPPFDPQILIPEKRHHKRFAIGQYWMANEHGSEKLKYEFQIVGMRTFTAFIPGRPSRLCKLWLGMNPWMPINVLVSDERATGCAWFNEAGEGADYQLVRKSRSKYHAPYFDIYGEL